MLTILGISFFLVSIIFTMFGLGGGTLYVPILLAFSFSYPVSAGTSLILVTVGALSAAVIYARSGFVDWKFAIAINSVSDLAAFFGGYSLFSSYLLRGLLALVMLASGTLILLEKKIEDINVGFSIKPNTFNQGRKLLSLKKYRSLPKFFRGSLFTWNHQFRGATFSIPVPFVLAAFSFVGFWSGALGIGGGIFKIPIMIVACGFPLRIAIATSSLMIVTSSFWGMMGHFKAGTLDLHIGILLAAIVFLGGQIGSRTSIKTHKDVLKKGFAVILYLVAITMIISVIFP